jgi:hypothetical protein
MAVARHVAQPGEVAGVNGRRQLVRGPGGPQTMFDWLDTTSPRDLGLIWMCGPGTTRKEQEYDDTG